MRGFLSGVIWGGVAMGVGLGALLLMSPAAPRPDLKSDAPASVKTEADSGNSGIAAVSRDPDLVEAPPSALTQDTAEGLGDTAPDTSTAQTPQVVAEPSRPSAPEPGEAGAGPQVEQAEATTGTRPQAPEAPRADPALAEAPDPETPQPQIETSPEAPVAADTGSAPEPPATRPAPGPQGEAPQMAQQTATEAPPEAPAAPEPAPASSAAPITRAETAEPEEAPEAPQAAPEPPQVAEAPSNIAAPEGTDAPAKLPAPPQAPPRREAAKVEEPAPAPAPKEEPAQTEAENQQVAALPQAGSGDQTLRPTIGQRVVPLTERGKPAAPETTGEATAETPPEQSGPPLQRYAEVAENPDGKPLMAIVLIDDDDAIGIEALAEFPYPLTFAVDPTAPDAAEKMAKHRDAGFEVVAIFDLPRGATPQDAEVSLSAGFDRLPEALAIMEGTGAGVQGNRRLSDQVAAFAGSTGRGLITLGNGLNTMQKLALREGVPAAAVFRDFDGAGQTPTVMRRFLDQAAFRAGQEGAVVMLGRVRPDTVSSLLIWGLQDRASRVALVPVSAVLKQVVSEQ